MDYEIVEKDYVDRIFTPTNDFVFKSLFGKIGNEDITKDLVETILNRKFNSITLDKQTVLTNEEAQGKSGTLDVRLTADDVNDIDIEMQVAKFEYMADRGLWYWAKMYVDSIKKGRYYSDTKRVICIMILDFELDDLKDIPKFLTTWKIKEVDFGHKVLTDKFELDIIELMKIDKADKKNKKLLEWCEFMLYPEKVGESSMSEYIKKAKEELDKINSDDEAKRIAFLREKAEMDKNQLMYEGIQKGLEEGLKQGKKEGFTQTAKKMLQKNIDINTISEVTGLSTDEIKKLK